MKMERSEWQLSHTMPAFVGDAQSVESDWRIPSFKGILRHWWRIVVGGENPAMTVPELLQLEGRIFGQVLDTDHSNKSKVTLAFAGRKPALSNTPWPGNMGKIKAGNFSVDAELYLGFGAISKDRGKPAAPKYARWIEPGTNYQLLMSHPPEYRGQLMQAFAAMHHLGGMGNRSRRGWGSICLLDHDNHAACTLADLLNGRMIDLESALSKDWVSGFAKDNKGPLIWESDSRPQWQKCVGDLASHLKLVSTTMRRYEKKDKDETLATLGGINPRWGSLLRLKVFKASDGLRMRFIFLPCQPPSQTSERKKLPKLEQHHCEHLISHLDSVSSLSRLNLEANA